MRFLRERPPVSPGTSVIAVASGVFLAFVALDAGGVVQPLVLPYLVLVPGLAIMRAAGFRATPASVSLAMALSVGVNGVIGLALIAVGRFDPLLAAVLLVTVVLVALLADESLRRVRDPVDAGNAAADGDRANAAPAPPDAVAQTQR
jgi:hypothetical protein